MSILLVISAVFISTISAFPDGAPIEACIYHNHPNHPGAKSLNPNTAPYDFIAYGDTYHPGSTIQVEIKGPAFKGFFLQAREPGPKGKWIGEWIKTPHSKVYPECSSATHTHMGPKKSVRMTWVAPKNKRGKVIFLVTILAKYDMYWPNVLAKVVRANPNHF